MDLQSALQDAAANRVSTGPPEPITHPILKQVIKDVQEDRAQADMEIRIYKHARTDR